MAMFPGSVVSVLLFYIPLIISQGCEDNTQVGEKRVSRYKNEFDKGNGLTVLLTSDLYKVKCCGLVKEWEFYSGQTGKMELQIWRPTEEAGKYSLVGFKHVSVTRKTQRKVAKETLDPQNQVPVQKDDVIGVHSLTSPIIKYNSEPSDGGIWVKAISEKQVEGVVADFSDGAEYYTGRIYGVNLLLTESTPPQFEEFPEVTIKMDHVVGSPVYTVNPTDADKGDDSLTVAMTDSEFFLFDSNTNEVKVSATLSVPPDGQEFKLELKVTDRCGKEGIGTLTVRVDYVPPITYPVTQATTAAPDDTDPITDPVTDPIDKDEDKEGDGDGDGVEEGDLDGNNGDIDTDTDTDGTNNAPGSQEAQAQDEDSDVFLGKEWALPVIIVAGIIFVVIIVFIVIGLTLHRKEKRSTAPSKSDVEKGQRKSRTATQNGSSGKPPPEKGTDSTKPADTKGKPADDKDAKQKSKESGDSKPQNAKTPAKDGPDKPKPSPNGNAPSGDKKVQLYPKPKRQSGGKDLPKI